MTPFGLTLSKDEKTIYVALLAFNAVAVIDVPTRKVNGHDSNGLGANPRGPFARWERIRLYVTSARGYGAGPNGGAGFVKPPPEPTSAIFNWGRFRRFRYPLPRNWPPIPNR